MSQRSEKSGGEFAEKWPPAIFTGLQAAALLAVDCGRATRRQRRLLAKQTCRSLCLAPRCLPNACCSLPFLNNFIAFLDADQVTCSFSRRFTRSAMLPGTSASNEEKSTNDESRTNSTTSVPATDERPGASSTLEQPVTGSAEEPETPMDLDTPRPDQHGADIKHGAAEAAGSDSQKRPVDGDYVTIETKKKKLDEFSEEAVVDFVTKSKETIMELSLDHLLEMFYLEHLGNIMEVAVWRKKPPTDALRQFITQYLSSDDDELPLLLASKVLPDSAHGSAKVSTSLPHDAFDSTPSPLTSSTSSSLLGVNATSNITSRSSPLAQSAPGVITEGSGSLTQRPQVTVPRSPRTSFSAKTTSAGLLTGTGAAVYVSRSHQTRQHSISASMDVSIGSQEQIVERAKQEAFVVQRIAELRKEGLWAAKRLPKVQEPERIKAHWDYLLEEMKWLATDFASERKWKKNAAKKCARMVMRYHQDKEAQKEKEKREELARLRRIASTIAKDIRAFWCDVEKIVDFKYQTRMEEKRKKALDMQLNFIVGQTEKFSNLIAQGLEKSNAPSIAETVDTATSLASETFADARTSDVEFEPDKDESDDEETIAKEEAEAGIGDQSEIEMLQRESEMPIEDLLSSLPQGAMPSRESEDEPGPSKEEDDDFSVSADEEDDEETISKQEEAEDTVDHAAEINDLENEANLTVEQLREKYSGAYADDFELPEDDIETDIDDESDEDTPTVDDDQTEEDEMEVSEAESGGNEEVGMEFLINPESPEKTPQVSSSAIFKFTCPVNAPFCH